MVSLRDENINPRDDAKKYYEQGLSLKDVSERLGVNYNTIKQWKSRYKWKQSVTKKKKKKVTKKVTVTGDYIAPEKSVQISVEEPLKLTEKQKLFAEIYIRNFNATQAAIKAGYSPDSAYTIGYENLNKPQIREYINQLKALKKESIIVSETDILERYMRIAFADMTDFMDFGSYDVPMVVNNMVVRDNAGNIITTKENGIVFKESKVVDGGLICEISSNRQGTKIKLEDRQKALDFLAKYFGMNPEHKHRVEYDSKKLQLEQERFQHTKDLDSKKEW